MKSPPRAPSVALVACGIMMLAACAPMIGSATSPSLPQTDDAAPPAITSEPAAVGSSLPPTRTLSSADRPPTFVPNQLISSDARFVLALHEEIVPGEGDYIPSALAFMPNSHTLAIGSAGLAPDNPIELWDAPSAQRIAELQGHTSWVTALTYSSDGALLVSAGHDGVARLWRSGSGEPLAALVGHEGGIWDIVISPNGALVATAGADLTVRLWNARDGRMLATGRAHTLAPRRLQFSADSSQLVSAGMDGALVIWSLPEMEIAHAFVMHGESVTDVAFVPGANLLISVSADDTMRLWDVETGQELRVISTRNQFLSWVRVVSIDPIEVVTIARNGDTRLWRIDETEGGLVVDEWWYVDPTAGNIWAISLSPDNTLLAMGDNMGALHVYDIQYGRRIIFQENAHQDGITALAFSDDGAMMATGGLDGRIRVWVAGPPPTPLPTRTPAPWTMTPLPEISPTPTSPRDETLSATPTLTLTESETPSPESGDSPESEGGSTPEG